MSGAIWEPDGRRVAYRISLRDDAFIVNIETEEDTALGEGFRATDWLDDDTLIVVR